MENLIDEADTNHHVRSADRLVTIGHALPRQSELYSNYFYFARLTQYNMLEFFLSQNVDYRANFNPVLL